MHTLCNNKDKPKNYYYFTCAQGVVQPRVEAGYAEFAKGLSTHDIRLGFDC